MIVYDPIYGSFEVPQFLERLILAPEVRRLMSVRLLNAPSPSLPTLSEIRRFSHTLGVLRLALLNPQLGLTKEEVRAFVATILIHDAATPPFAHLLEYYLKDRAGWDHETALPDLLTGHNFLGNTAHQILPGEELKFKRLCSASKIDFDLVLQIARKQHVSSGLLFGALDFDNLDNVLRMAWALGLEVPRVSFLNLARELAVSIDGEILLSERHDRSIKVWSDTRRKVYQILVFDAVTVATQAVLTKAISLHFGETSASEIQWANRDQDLLEMLARSPRTKELMLRSFNETLPSQIFSLRVGGKLSDFGLRSRDEAITLIENIASEEFGIRRAFAYAFVDRSAFSKRLQFVDPATRKHWTTGKSSESVVFYCFANETEKQNARLEKPFCDALLKALGENAKIHVDETVKDRFAS